MSKTFFITGGSGYIGSVIIEYAVAQGYSVTALPRSESSDFKLRALGANPVRGDLKSLEVLRAEASKADIVINVADAIASDFNISQDERWATNYAANDALAAGVKGTDKPLIITSGAMIAQPHPQDEETDENSPGWPQGHLYARGFESRKQTYLDQGIRVCYVRLAPVSSSSPGTALTTTVHVEDAARLYLVLAERAVAGESYNATSETDVQQKQILETIYETLGFPCEELHVKEVNAKMGVFLAVFMTATCRSSNKKAREQLGWSVQAEKGILEEIRSRSYVEVAKEMKTQAK
ncbi:hypothetical protein PMIN06_010540 [Paraphaeosphaeria minitans]|uniref:NAD-dependent epimerase/dehydratase domain-containing protein n=1 Tax=Paraphaeosphaeria minitans TaxID=565426 RepID=A0A9P6G8K2_9PLEO|nr:hypothetical protein PMIN01_11475 [Paraphaeosphaeria minitans]